MDKVYEDFVNLVASQRPLTLDEVEEVARGRVWSGMQAVDRGLVDRTGTLQDAIDAAARIAGLGDRYAVHYIEPQLSALENFILELTTGALQRLDLSSAARALAPQSLLQSILDDLRLLTAGNRRLTVAAHCLCGIR